MTVSVRDARAQPADRRWLESVYRDYLDDLAPLGTGVFPILGEVGHSEPDQLARWFADSSAQLLVICKGAAPAGFAMVARGGSAFGRTPVDFRMAEFFVSRAQRRLGVGRTAVPLILDRFAGRWEIVEYLRNPGAVDFWRRVVAQYTRGDYQERINNGEVRQTFVSGTARRPGAPLPR
jgi:predicted acetyltransferase